MIRNRQKDDPDLHQDDDEKGILDPVPFDTGLEQARMTTTDNFTVIPEFNSGQALNLIQDLLKNDSGFRQDDGKLAKPSG